jgi:hypothetical protein
MPEEEGFLNRWSRRKLAEKDAPDPGPAVEEARLPAAAEETGPEAGTAETEDGEAPARHPAEDIDIDSLDHTSDFSVFLQKGVPAAIKRKALRKLWVSDPILSAREQLNDDFDIADVKTWGIGPSRGSAWKFGRGFQTEEELPPPPRRPGPPESQEAQDAVARAEPDMEDAESGASEEAAETDGEASAEDAVAAPRDTGRDDDRKA